MTGRLVEKSAASVARKKLLAEAGYRTGLGGLRDALDAGRRATGDFYLAGRKQALRSNVVGARVRRDAALGKADRLHPALVGGAIAAGGGLAFGGVAAHNHRTTGSWKGLAGQDGLKPNIRPATRKQNRARYLDMVERHKESQVKKAHQQLDAFAKDTNTLVEAGALGGAGYGAYRVGAARQRKLIADGKVAVPVSRPKPVAAPVAVVAPAPETVVNRRRGARRAAPAGQRYASHVKPGRLVRAVGAIR